MKTNFKKLTEKQLQSYSDAYRADEKNRALTHIFSKIGLGDLSYDPEKARAMLYKFSLDLKTMSATNQKGSGRCWLFAATNLLREKISKELNLGTFELSQSYLAFWDKFERCNYFFDCIVDTADLPDGDRTVDHILETGVNDGGQWDMFVNIVRKYGVVPKDAYPETEQSSSTGNLNRFLNNYLKKTACTLRRAKKKDIPAIKEEALSAIYSFLCACYTEPPKQFDFEYIDKDGKYHRDPGYTPLSFRDKYVGDFLDDCVSIINAPTADKPFGHIYTVKYLGNIVGGKEVRHLNLPMDEFKAAILAQMQDGEPVWFGSDVGHCGDGATKVWDDQSHDYTLLTGLDAGMSKADMLDYHAAAMNHAMVLSGVNLVDGKPTRWKIENSWGDGGPHGGYHIASDSWFDLYVMQAVVRRKYLAKYEKVLDEEAKVLLPWDPMGSLAD